MRRVHFGYVSAPLLAALAACGTSDSSTPGDGSDAGGPGALSDAGGAGTDAARDGQGGVGGDAGTSDSGAPLDGSADAAAGDPWPEWVFRHWIWEGESTQDSAAAIVEGYRSRNIPVGAIVIDSPWETGYTTFAWDTTLFPNAGAMIDAFHQADVRVVLWNVSFINPEASTYADAAAKKYFMQLTSFTGPEQVSWWKGKGALLDYFNPAAVAWWHGLMKPVLDQKIDGWKTDGSDFSVIKAPYSPGKGSTVARTQYAEAYYRDFFETTRKALGPDRVLLARPVDNYGNDVGGSQVAFAPRDIGFAGWVGDQDATFDGLKAALNNMYYSSQQGYLTFGSDIGGYRTDPAAPAPLGRTKELFVRWAALGAFCTIMENGGGGEHRPWMFDDETVAFYRTFTDLHYQLIPYFAKTARAAYAAADSMVHFADKATYAYTLGPDVFVAPFLATGTQIHVTLPAGGSWVYLFDKTKVYAGGSGQDLTIPLGEFPVFLRQGSGVEGTLVVHR